MPIPQPGDASEYIIQGRKLVCPVCGSERFSARKNLMNAAALAFFGFEWADKRAENYVCGNCGYVMWFLTEKTVP